MSLDTQTFGITRYWLSVALSRVPTAPDIFRKAQLSVARKAFLAGKNQLDAIKSWLANAQILKLDRGNVELSSLGKLMAAQDERAQKAWTWWLFHLHLCVNEESFPYSTFFLQFDSEGRNWMSFDEVLESLASESNDGERQYEATATRKRLEGVEKTFRPGWPIHSLGLVERRSVKGERGKERLRRCLSSPSDIVVAYGAMLFQHVLFSNQNTIETRKLVEKGLARALGLSDTRLRESFARLHQHAEFSDFLQYHRKVNMDSVQFRKIGAPALIQIRKHAYASGEVRWP